MADIFISYKREERQAVERLASTLKDLGLTVWFDASMSAGETFSDEIDREAHAAKAILVCWSPAARDSQWVKAEALIGFEQSKLATCYVAGPDGFYPPTPFNSIHAEDLRAWLTTPTDMHAGWKSVLRRIGKLCVRTDLESYGALDVQASALELRAWIAAFATSPLFMSVESLLNSREAEDAERTRLEQEARERWAREEANRRSREEKERKVPEGDERRGRVKPRPRQVGSPRVRVWSAIFTLVSAGALTLALGLALNIQSYHRLTFERPVAAIELRQRGAQLFDAIVIEPPTARDPEGVTRTFQVRGDEWRIEARILRWKPWASVLGLDSQYRLDRFSGRYTDAQQELTGERSAYDIRPTGFSGVDLWPLARDFSQYAPLVDTLYGSGAYMPMAEGARYEVRITQNGLIARPTNDMAAEASSSGWQ